MKKIIIVLLGLIIIDLLVGVLCRQYIKHLEFNGSPLAIDKRILFEEESDVILMGASQVRHGYKPSEFSSVLGMNVFNGAQDGIDVINNHIYLEAIFDRKAPKIVVLDIFPAYLDGSMKYRLRNLNMWYGISKPVTDYFNKQATWQEKVKLKSNLYIYNSLVYHVVRTILRADQSMDGFSALSGHYDGTMDVVDNNFTVDSLELDYLNKIVKLCKTHKSFLFIAQQPNFVRNDRYNHWLNAYCEDNNITLLDHVNDTTFTNHYDFFADAIHLNEVGASMYSKILAEEIKSIITD